MKETCLIGLWISYGRRVEVKVGSDISKKCVVENGTPQGSVISPTLVSIVINYILGKIPANLGWPLFADDEALWMGGI